MSTYTIAETALLALVRAYAGGGTFNSQNSAIDNWLMLDSSNQTAAAVIEMAGESREAIDTSEPTEYGAYGEYQEVHQVGVWICQPRGAGDGGDGIAKAAVKTLTEAVKDYLRPYRLLNAAAGVRSAQIVRTTAPTYISPTTDIAQATHVAQEIVMIVVCTSTAPDGEIDG